MHEKDVRKAEKLYAAIDESPVFHGTVEKEDRSLMNVCFVSGDAEKDAEFIALAKEHNMINLKGHRSVGGLRASIYNAVPEESVDALVELLKNYK
jgi:phosphoserine aminotransferase